MKRLALAHRRRRRPGFFHPVPLRPRADGWTVRRQCEFLALLYVSGSVTAAASGAGMTRETAYRLRRRAGAESFAAAWDRVLTPPGSGRARRVDCDYRKVTNETLFRRAETGLVQPVIYRGRMTAIRWKPDDSALLRLVKRLPEAAPEGGADGRA